MLDFNKDKNNCTGCSACSSVCPQQCIQMKPDEEGFMYPELSEGCIQCGLCEKVCPLVNDRKESVSKKIVYCAISNDNQTWRNSSSGGAFSEICRVWNDGDSTIFGAAWNGLQVKHIGVNGYKNIDPLRKSKYVASDIDDSFRQIKILLNDGKFVIFSGTPCQVAGLNTFLRKRYDNLLTIDLICHGVGSPKVFNSCIELLEKQFKNKITSYQFRAKKEQYITDYISKVRFEGAPKEVYIYTDRYNQLFLNQLCLRPSCGKNCIFRDERRPGDITLADFRGTTKLFPDLAGVRKNYSSIVANTDKGLEVIQKLDKFMLLREYSYEGLIEFNPLFSHHTWFADGRDDFFHHFVEDPSNTVLGLTEERPEFKLSLKRKILNLLPTRIRAFVLIYISKKQCQK